MTIKNARELKLVVSQRETASFKDLAKAINIKLRLADENENDAKNHRQEAGQMLVTLRKRVESDKLDWWQFVYDYFDRPRKEIEKLMAFVPANKIAQAAIRANPAKSNRAIADETGVSKDTIRRAREATGANASVEKRVGRDGKVRKMPERERATALTVTPVRKRDKLPSHIPDVLKQAGAFHIEVMNFAVEFCERIKAWHAAHPELEDEGHSCVVQALEKASMTLQLTAQEIDGRSSYDDAVA